MRIAQWNNRYPCNFHLDQGVDYFHTQEIPLYHFLVDYTKDLLHNLQLTVQSENMGPPVLKVLRISRR